ncbi:hypothetical protein EXIGLDRAFT_838560 [Exidia glandulosa HHB12029]|uniref:Zn(2)-C6 fungal-type domain-containing protein n=1 Tax=Exidia glandulosa HHB12029 TaxID=1314781 RepID=A0A165FQK1_EXIGL|nr:hypothetical protein EXIGLDRAFT_838560 [Exidia glandulosa HHB12029]
MNFSSGEATTSGMSFDPFAPVPQQLYTQPTHDMPGDISPYDASDDGSPRRTKLPRHARGACRRCKKLKMKCEYTDESGPCTRCRTNEHACEVEPRKHTSQKNARSALLRQVQRKDALIASLLRHVYSTMAAGQQMGAEERGHRDDEDESMQADDEQQGPVGLTATHPESAASSSRSSATGHDASSVKRDPSTLPAPMPASAYKQACSQLDLVRSGAVGVDEIESLFSIFFSHINAQISLLDPALHAPRQMLHRCPFLFTTVCAVAAKHLPRPGAYSQAMACARRAAAEALISNRKTVEMCQAYILLGEFAPLAPTWEEDRSSLFRGLAIRLALDLDLSHPPEPDLAPLEKRNLQRTWFVCAWLDWMSAMQSGRTISFPDDALLRSSSTWFAQSAGMPSDAHLCASVDLLRVVRRFADLFSGAGAGDDGGGVNVDAMIRVYDEAVTSVLDEWRRRIQRVRTATDPMFSFRTHVLVFLYHYCKLRMLSVILERSVQSTEPASEACYLRCWHTGLAAVTEIVDEIAPSGNMQFSPDQLVKYTALAAAFTLKLLAPRFAAYVSPSTKHVAVELVERLVGVLEADSPGPQGPLASQLYAQALRGLLLQYGREGISMSPGPGTTNDSVAGLNTMEKQLFSVLDASIAFA